MSRAKVILLRGFFGVVSAMAVSAAMVSFATVSFTTVSLATESFAMESAIAESLTTVYMIEVSLFTEFADVESVWGGVAGSWAKLTAVTTLPMAKILQNSLIILRTLPKKGFKHVK